VNVTSPFSGTINYNCTIPVGAAVAGTIPSTYFYFRATTDAPGEL